MTHGHVQTKWYFDINISILDYETHYQKGNRSFHISSNYCSILRSVQI